jgi:hypothetical protein
VPGSSGGARPGQRGLVCGDVIPPETPLDQVAGVELPVFFGAIEPLLEPGFLFVLADVEKKFQDRRPYASGFTRN